MVEPGPQGSIQGMQFRMKLGKSVVSIPETFIKATLCEAHSAMDKFTETTIKIIRTVILLIMLEKLGNTPFPQRPAALDPIFCISGPFCTHALAILSDDMRASLKIK